MFIVGIAISGHAIGGTNELYGLWKGADKFSYAVYGILKISKSSITWKGFDRAPRCTVTIQRVIEANGAEFKNQLGKVYVTAPDSSFETYLFKVSGGKCTGGMSHMRFTLETVLPEYPLKYLALVEYQGLENPIGYTHFFPHNVNDPPSTNE